MRGESDTNGSQKSEIKGKKSGVGEDGLSETMGNKSGRGFAGGFIVAHLDGLTDDVILLY